MLTACIAVWVAGEGGMEEPLGFVPVTWDGCCHQQNQELATGQSGCGLRLFEESTCLILGGWNGSGKGTAAWKKRLVRSLFDVKRCSSLGDLCPPSLLFPKRERHIVFHSSRLCGSAVVQVLVWLLLLYLGTPCVKGACRWWRSGHPNPVLCIH